MTVQIKCTITGTVYTGQLDTAPGPWNILRGSARGGSERRTRKVTFMWHNDDKTVIGAFL